MYGGPNHGRINLDRLRAVLAGLSLPRFDGGRLVPAVDVSPWFRSDAPCSAERLSCHVYGRAKSASQFIPGWPCSFVAVWSRVPRPGPRPWTRSDRGHRRPAPRSRRTAHHRGPVETGRPRRHLLRPRRLRRHPAGLGPAGPARRTGRPGPLRPCHAPAAKQTLGWTTPKLRTPEVADRWTWTLIVAHTQLRLARPLAEDLHRPWEKPTPPTGSPQAGVRRGFRNIRAHLACPTRVPKPRGAGHGRPPGSKNKHRAPRYDVGKTVKRTETLKAIGKPGRSWWIKLRRPAAQAGGRRPARSSPGCPRRRRTRD
jgi:hypothetical protein